MNTRVAMDVGRLVADWTAAPRPWLDVGVVRERAVRTALTPATRELWKYTPIAAMVEAFDHTPARSGARWSGLDQPGLRAVAFSRLDPADGMLVAAALAGGFDTDRHLLGDLALLRGADGMLLEVTGAPTRPIELAHDAAGTTLVVLIVRPQAKAVFIERQDAPPFSAQLIVADVGRDARLEHHRGAYPGDAGLWAMIQARVHDNAVYNLNQQVLGGRRCRMETHVTLAGRGASATLTGAYLVAGGHHLDQQFVIEHQAPDTFSRQQFHGIGTGKGHSVFNGRIHIHPHATRSDAWLSNRNLALHADAEMNTKPELEIYTDDVRCAHGATVGQLSTDSLFFLTTRGIPETAARTMLAHAFLRECIAGPLADEGTARLLGRDPMNVDIRPDFPILDTQVHGARLVYLDNAATTQKPRQVIEAISNYYLRDNANVHRGAHALSERATQAFEGARESVRRFLAAPDAREIIFTRGTTESINLVANSLAGRLAPGDEILISLLEHHSNIVPWQMLAERTGARLRACDITDDGDIDLASFRALLSERTRLVAFAHVSNSLGTVNPVEELTRLARAAGALVLIDGAQAVAHLPVDVQQIGCDFYAFSGHKLFGPTGIGVLWGKLELLDSLPPWQGGGQMIEHVTIERSTWQRSPYRFEAGTPDIAGVIGLGTAIEYLEQLPRAQLLEQEDRLVRAALDGLAAIPGVRLIGRPREQLSVISFLLGDGHPQDVGTLLDQQGIAVRAGHHCTMPLMQRLGIPGTVRASFSLYNSMGDVDRLLAGIEKTSTFL